MESMTAPKIDSWITLVLRICATYGAIIKIGKLSLRVAGMIFSFPFWHTLITFLTVIKVFTWTSYALATPITMEVFLSCLFIVIHFTMATEVLSEFNVTLLTSFCWFLNFFTFSASYFCYIPPFHLMLYFNILLKVIYFIVTQSAWEELFTFRTFQRASPFIMFTS